MLSILGSAGMIIASLVVYAYFIRGAFDGVSQLRSEAASRERIKLEQQNAVQQAQNLLAQFQSVADLQDLVSLALPLQENVTQALNQFQAIAQASQLSLQSASLQRLAITTTARQSIIKGVGRLRFTLRLLGSYESIKGFVNSLQNSVRLSDVASLSFQRTGAAGQNLYTANLVVDVYYQSQ